MSHNNYYQILSAIYNFLAQAMRYPNSDTITDEFIKYFFSIIKDISHEDKQQKMEKFIKNNKNWLEELQLEHTRLFINNSEGKLPATPYASFYINQTLAGKYSEDVKNYYRLNGFEFNVQGDFPDHIAYELEFLSLLVKNEMIEKEQEFIKKYFRIWFPEFKNIVITSSILPFYPIVMELIDLITTEEDNNVNEI